MPAWVPVPALAEIQIAIENAVAVITKQKGFELKKVMRTGTVVSVDNRNWELGLNSGIAKKVIPIPGNRTRYGISDQSQLTAFALESLMSFVMLSDNPLHGVLKLPRMANDFFDTQINNHWQLVSSDGFP